MAQSNAIKGAILRGIATAENELFDQDQEYFNIGGIRFLFNSGDLIINNPFTLKCDSGIAVLSDSIIGCCVTAVYNTNSSFVFVFDGRISLEISLREEDFICPEAAVFVHHTGDTLMFQ